MYSFVHFLHWNTVMNCAIVVQYCTVNPNYHKFNFMSIRHSVVYSSTVPQSIITQSHFSCGGAVQQHGCLLSPPTKMVSLCCSIHYDRRRLLLPPPGRSAPTPQKGSRAPTGPPQPMVVVGVEASAEQGNAWHISRQKNNTQQQQQKHSSTAAEAQQQKHSSSRSTAATAAQQHSSTAAVAVRC